MNNIDLIKMNYPKGTKILLEHMGFDPRPIPDNTIGNVISVDDIGTIHCEFENGRTLGLILGEDSFHKV